MCSLLALTLTINHFTSTVFPKDPFINHKKRITIYCSLFKARPWLLASTLFIFPKDRRLGSVLESILARQPGWQAPRRKILEVAFEHSRVLAIFCSTFFTSDHPCTMCTLYTLNTIVVWSENPARKNREHSRVLECHLYYICWIFVTSANEA